MQFVVALAAQSANTIPPLIRPDTPQPEPPRPATPARRYLRRLTQAQIDALVAERQAGAQIKELAAKYEIDRSTVLAHLERAGVPGRRFQGRVLTAEKIQAAGELYASGINLIQVGERFNVDRRYLRKVLPEAGFPLRSPGQQKRS